MLSLDLATVLLQWATGGLFFLWVTTRRREVGIGYGWLMRGIFGVMAIGGAVAGFRYNDVLVRDISGLAVGLAALGVTVVSIVRRKAGVLHQREQVQTRTARVAEMTGIEREEQHFSDGPEFPPGLDLIAPAFGLVGLIAAGLDAGSPTWLQLSRVLVGAVFLGAVTDAMALGHWYLTQPGLPRAPLLQLVHILAIVWPIHVVTMLLPTGMISVFSGAVDDGWGGMLGWYWAASAVATIVLIVVTRAALKERGYSAVMAATGLLYLAMITAFSQDLVARLVLTG